MSWSKLSRSWLFFIVPDNEFLKKKKIPHTPLAKYHQFIREKSQPLSQGSEGLKRCDLFFIFFLIGDTWQE